MGYTIGGSFLSGVNQPALSMGGWRCVAGARLDAITEMYSYDPSFRVRNIKLPTSLFTRDWVDALDGALPMPFNNTVPQTVTPDAVVFDLTLPTSSINWTVNPSPVVFDFSVPDAFAMVGGLLTPNPVVFSLLAAAVQLNQAALPSPVPFGLVAPTVLLGRSLIPNPVVFNLSPPSVQLLSTLTPGPVVFNLVPATVGLYNNRLTPSPVVFSFTPPTSLALYGRVMFPDPVVITLLPVTPTLVPGEVTMSPDPVRLYMRMPYPMANYFMGEPAHQVLTSITYLVRLSNAVVGEQVLPASSVQASSQSLALYELDNVGADVNDPAVGPRDEISIQVPNGASYVSALTAFLAEESTTLVQVLERVTYASGYVSDRTISVSRLLTVNRNRGPRNDTTTLRCSGQSARQATRVVAIPQTRVREARSDDEGRLSARLHYDLDEVRSSRVDGVGQHVSPGDTVTIDGQTFVVAKVSINLSSSDRYLDVSARSA